MKTSPKPTAWIGLGFTAVTALAVAYNLGRTSAESGSRPQRHQNAASKDDPDLRSALSAAQKRLARCEETLQRHDQHPQKREEKPHTNEDNPTPPPEPALPKQCIIASQVKELHMLSASCRSLRRHFDAYKTILGSSTIDCEIVLDILSTAQIQSAFCAAIIRNSEGTTYRDATSDPLAIAAVEDAYATRNKYGDLENINDLVKNPECIARMRTE
ncbi:hypothetical protein WMF31_05650 [Sorangium sp. So ce1036]|uniref:hypothetical protein n=1 Tax=Sorangium sp. So ce1036 TaxID=3133328 RepID=UPI003F04AD75